jgi:leucyl/phenylalanyl-tRNA--protein transferase
MQRSRIRTIIMDELLSIGHPVGPTRWRMRAEEADEEGIVGAGADLEVSTLVAAYRDGIFPWPHPGVPLLWFSPDPRAVIELDAVRISRRLRTRLRQSGWVTTLSQALPQVIEACAERGRTGTWITPEMRDAYVELGALDWVHSIEVWEDGELVGGLYGVLVGGVFTGESMFHRRDDASKVALIDLCARLRAAGATLLDVQLPTDHLRSMGATTLARAAFLARLRAERDRPVRPVRGPLQVARLVAAGSMVPAMSSTRTGSGI